MSNPNSQLQSFRQALKQSKKPCALAGAGLSAASGIPTFRGSGGFWRQNDSMSLATNEAFKNDPSKVWQFYHYRRELCLKSLPNSAHHALAFLSTFKGSQEIFPNSKNSFNLITQNVDGLSIRACNKIKEFNPKFPIEMHGSLFKTKCLNCNQEKENFDSPINEFLKGTENIENPYNEIEISKLPHCKDCKGLLRPSVVWFGENIPCLNQIDKVLEDCDLLLVLGTSSVVYPAANFASQIQSKGGKTAVFNIEENQNESPDWFFKGKVEETLPWALGLS